MAENHPQGSGEAREPSPTPTQSPLSHWTSLANGRFKDSSITSFKMGLWHGALCGYTGHMPQKLVLTECLGARALLQRQTLSLCLPGHLLAVGISLRGQDSLHHYHWLRGQGIRFPVLLEIQLSLGTPMCSLPPRSRWGAQESLSVVLPRPEAPLGGAAAATSHLSCEDQ